MALKSFSSTMPGVENTIGSGMMSCMPTLVIDAACSWPTPIFRSMSPSLPCVPPA